MEGPPLSEFSSLVAPDLFDRYPDFEPHARSDDGNLIVNAPMPSGDGTIVISALQMPTVRVEIHGCPESRRDFDDPDETFEYVDKLRVGTRESMDQFQDYDAGGIAVLTYRYEADHEPALGFSFQFTTVAGDIPEDVVNELIQQEILPQSLLADYFFHGRRCFGFVVHEDVSTSVAEEHILNVRHFLRSDVRVQAAHADPLVDDTTLIDADLRFLAEEDPDVRLAAMSAIVGHARLHRRRDHFGRLLDLVLPGFDSHDAAVREEVVKVSSALASAGPEIYRQAARTLLARAVGDSAANVRSCVGRNVAPLLHPIGGAPMSTTEQAEFLRDLRPLLSDDDADVVAITIANFGLFDMPDATKALLELTNSDATRANAILGLQRRVLRAGEVVPRLLAVAEDESLSATDRGCAVETLGYYGEQTGADPRIEAVVLGSLSHAEPLVNFGALRALVEFEPSEMPEARILELTGSDSDDVRAQSYMTIVARRLDSDAAFDAVYAGTQAINRTVRECAEHAWNELFPGRQPDPEQQK